MNMTRLQEIKQYRANMKKSSRRKYLHLSQPAPLLRCPFGWSPATKRNLGLVDCGSW